MDLAIQYNFTASELKQINLSRIYLQVLTISDITTVNGHRILPCILQGHRDVHRISTLEWPRSERPQNCSAWSRMVQHFSTGGRLSQPLREWIGDLHQQWTWFYDTSSNAVCQQEEPDKWYYYTPCPASRLTHQR
jgi:hypothetical protein